MTKRFRLTTPKFKKELQDLSRKTMETVDIMDDEISPDEWGRMCAWQFYEWAREDGTLEVNNIAHPEKLKPFIPEPYIPSDITE